MLIPCILMLAAALGQAPAADEAGWRAEVEEAYARGVKYLVDTQNKDGSWGSHRTARYIEVLADVPGSLRAFKSATSALCLLALDTVPPKERTPAVEEAIAKGLEYQIEHALVKRPNSAEIYLVWAYGYGLEALGTLIPKIQDPEVKQRAEETARNLIEGLALYQTLDGGWGYFDFDYGTYRPAGSSMSFTTATVMVGLHRARQAGIEVPGKVIDKALRSLRIARKEDGSYIYGDYMKYIPNHPVNMVKGSISRSAACHLAQYYFGVESVTRDDLRQALEALLQHQHFADIGRKRPIPHEAWYATSGYFFLYGQYYSALAMRELPPEDRMRFAPSYAKILLDLQDPDGSWWDYPLYSFHKAYGTGYAVLSLSVYRGFGE